VVQPNVLVRNEPTPLTLPEAIQGGVYYTPRVDIYETPEELVFLVDLPGVKPPEVELRFEKGELILHGKVYPRPQPPVFLAAEYGVGDFYRSFNVYVEINPGKILAEYKFGVLTIHLPKSEKVKPKKIAVKSE
jgi:HSP20 family protein